MYYKLVCTLIILLSVQVSATIKMSVISDTGIISVEPETINAQEQGIGVGDTFTDSICITNTPYITQWVVVNMRFNPQVLQCIDIIEGPFLKQNGSTLFVYQYIDNISGIITEFTCIMLSGSPVAGSGTLCYIKWAVVGYGSSQLDIEYAYLLEGLGVVPCTWTDGYFELQGGPGVVTEPNVLKPSNYLLQVYPNPFGNKAVITYQLPTKSMVSLKIYDIAGRLVNTVFDGIQPARYYSTTFDASGMMDGVYFLKLGTQDKVVTKKLVVVR